MPGCGVTEKLFLSDVEGSGRGPLAFEKANAAYNRAVRTASSPSGPNWRAAKRWVRDARCPEECPDKGTMIIGPYVTHPTYDIKRNPNRVTIRGRAGCLASVHCRSLEA